MFVVSSDESILKAGVAGGPGNGQNEIDNLPPNTQPVAIDDRLSDLVGLKSGKTKLVLKEQFYNNNPNDPSSPFLIQGADRDLTLDVTVQ